MFAPFCRSSDSPVIFTLSAAIQVKVVPGISAVSVSESAKPLQTGALLELVIVGHWALAMPKCKSISEATMNFRKRGEEDTIPIKLCLQSANICITS
jgi:hypothetical protein